MMRQNFPPISILLLLLSFRASSQQDGFKDDVTEELSPSNDFWSSLVTNPMYEVPVASGHVYFTEPFQTKEGFLKRWTMSQVGAEETARPASKHDGLWRIEEMKRSSLRGDLGLVLKRSSKYHAISVHLDEPFEFDDKPLIVQYEVKFQADQDCGGAYIKLLTKDDKLDLSNFSGKTPYTIMFGPDKCGKDEKIHFIFRHKNPVTGHFEERHSRPPSVEFGEIFTDKKIHLFTLGVYPNSSFEIYLDQTLINSGSLLKDTLQDESMDEKWESSVTADPVCLLSDGSCDPLSQPMIKGDPTQRRESLTQPLSSDPNSQDKSSQKMTSTPDQRDDQEPYRLLPISALGLELWSTSANIFFDNFIVTDDKQIADRWAENGWKQKKTMEIANSQGLRGFMVYLYDSGLERRWLWGVYAFVFLLPFILVSVFFCPETGPLFKASMIANAVRPGEEDEEAEARRKERKKERARRRKTSKKNEEQSEDQLKDKVKDEAAEEREEDTDGSNSSENESSHLQSRQKVRRRKTKKAT